MLSWACGSKRKLQAEQQEALDKRSMFRECVDSTAVHQALYPVVQLEDQKKNLEDKRSQLEVEYTKCPGPVQDLIERYYNQYGNRANKTRKFQPDYLMPDGSTNTDKLRALLKWFVDHACRIYDGDTENDDLQAMKNALKEAIRLFDTNYQSFVQLDQKINRIDTKLEQEKKKLEAAKVKELSNILAKARTDYESAHGTRVANIEALRLSDRTTFQQQAELYRAKLYPEDTEESFSVTPSVAQEPGTDVPRITNESRT